MSRETVYIDFKRMTGKMKRAYLIAADICKKEGYNVHMCNLVNREHPYSSKFKEFAVIKLKCPSTFCSECPGAPYNVKHYAGMWKDSNLKERRKPKKKDKSAFKLLKKLRG